MSGGLTKIETSHVWPISHGPLGACNEASGDTETLKTALKWLHAAELDGDKEALRSLAAQFTFGPEDAGCFEVNYLDGAFWPDFPDFASELRVASIDAITKALTKERRLVTVLLQVPDIGRPWCNVIESYSEIILLLTLPASPIDPT